MLTFSFDVALNWPLLAELEAAAAEGAEFAVLLTMTFAGVALVFFVAVEKGFGANDILRHKFH